MEIMAVVKPADVGKFILQVGDPSKPKIFYGKGGLALKHPTREEPGDGRQRTKKSPKAPRYKPTSLARASHNKNERTRRSRMKYCCEMLREIVPGCHDEMDKASVFELTVEFLKHVKQCRNYKCEDYIPKYPPPMLTKLHILGDELDLTSEDELED